MASAPSCGSWSRERAQLEAACALSGMSGHGLASQQFAPGLILLTSLGFEQEPARLKLPMWCAGYLMNVQPP